MTKEDCIEIGYIAKAHSTQGEVKAIFDVHDITHYQGIKLLYLSKKNAPLAPILVAKFTVRSNTEAILAFEGVNDKAGAELLSSNTLFVPDTFLPTLPDDQFYYFEIEGFQVEDAEKGNIGTVTTIEEQNGNDLLVVDFEGKEILIPMHEDIFLGVDKVGKKVSVKMPEGLLELYL